jgi:hypothetical protein
MGEGTMIRFLRYNTRHRIYHGDEGLQLNPMMSSSHRKDGSRTWSRSEPLWLFKLRQRWFAFAGRQRCGRRSDPFSMNRGDRPSPDTWDWGPDGNRTCSYCGSIHPDDLMKICRLVATDERYALEGTDKSYKVYVKQPDVHNASQGAIKFYMHHAPVTPTDRDQADFTAALRLSSERYRARWANRV